MEHQNNQSPSIPKWSALLIEAVTKPGPSRQGDRGRGRARTLRSDSPGLRQEPHRHTRYFARQPRRSELNWLIHRDLQREGIGSGDDRQTTVYVERKDMTGAERTFANSYSPFEDIIRYNSAGKVHKVNRRVRQSNRHGPRNE